MLKLLSFWLIYWCVSHQFVGDWHANIYENPFYLLVFSYSYNKAFDVSNKSAGSIHCTESIVEPTRFLCLFEPVVQRMLHCLRLRCALLQCKASPVAVSSTLHCFGVQNSLQSRLFPLRTWLHFYHDGTAATVSGTSCKVSFLSRFSATMQFSRWRLDIYLFYLFQYDWLEIESSEANLKTEKVQSQLTLRDQQINRRRSRMTSCLTIEFGRDYQINISLPHACFCWYQSDITDNDFLTVF